MRDERAAKLRARRGVGTTTARRPAFSGQIGSAAGAWATPALQARDRDRGQTWGVAHAPAASSLRHWYRHADRRGTKRRASGRAANSLGVIDIVIRDSHFPAPLPASLHSFRW